MELSVDLPDEDVEFLDEYVAGNGLASRSAAVQHAIHLLRISGGAERAAIAEDRAWDAAAISEGFD